MKDQNHHLNRYYAKMSEFRQDCKNSQIPYSTVMSFPEHYEVHCSTSDLFDFGFFDKRTIHWHGNSIMVRFENRAYYSQLLAGWDGVEYPATVISSVEIPDEPFWIRLLDTISKERPEREYMEQQNQERLALKRFYVDNIRPIRHLFINLGVKLTESYFTSLSSLLHCTSPMDWIHYDNLFRQAYWNLVKQMKKYYEMDVSVADDDDFKIALQYTHFYENYPFFSRMITDDCERCQDNRNDDDALLDLNFKTNYAVFCFVREHLPGLTENTPTHDESPIDQKRNGVAFLLKY